MKGLLVINKYVKSSRFKEFYDLIIKAFKSKDIELVLDTNEKINSLDSISTKDYNFVLFYDKDILFCRALEKKGFRVFNSSFAIEVCDDKALTQIELSNHDILMPKTMIMPFSFEKNFLDNKIILEEFSFPFIIKERKGSLGEQVYLVNNEQELNTLKESLNNSNVIVQEYINSIPCSDYRVYVVGNKFVGGIKRIASTNSFKSNVSQGGHMEVVEIPKEMIDEAERISKLLKLDFCGLDFMISEDKKIYFIEANSNAQYLEFFKVTGINIASFIAEYIKKEIKQ